MLNTKILQISELEGNLEEKNVQVDDLHSKISDIESENEGMKAKLADLEAKLKEADEEKSKFTYHLICSDNQHQF
jgi:chromosome segregation ATPase